MGIFAGYVGETPWGRYLTTIRPTAPSGWRSAEGSGHTQREPLTTMSVLAAPHRARLSQIAIAKAAAASTPATAANQAATSTDSFAVAMCWGRSASASV